MSFACREWGLALLIGLCLLLPLRAQDLPFYDEARAAAQAGQLDQALELFGKGIEAARQRQDPVGEALCQYEVGDIHFQREDYPQALTCFQQALPVFREARVAMAVEMIQFKSGLAYEALKQYDPAIVALEEALDSARGREETARVREIQAHLTRVYYEGERYASAIKTGPEAARLMHAANQLKKEAECLGYTALAYYALPQPDLAERYLARAVAAYTAAGDTESARVFQERLQAMPQEMARAVIELDRLLPTLKDPRLKVVKLDRAAIACLYLKRYPEARKYLESALKLPAPPHELAVTRGLLGRLEMRLDHPDKAAAFYEAAYRQLQPEAEARDYLMPALDAWDEAGQADRAIALAQEALKTMPSGKIQLLNQLAILQRHSGQLEAAQATVRQALALAPTPSEKGILLNNLGEVLQAQGDSAGALQCYQEAVGLLPESASIYNNQGTLNWSLGHYAEALELLLRALAMTRAERDSRLEGTVLNSLGLLYQFLGRDEQARECYQEALTLRRQEKDRRGEMVTLNNLGASWLEAHQDQKAVDSFGLALPIARALGDRYLEATLLNNLGMLRQGPSARSAFEQALKLEQQLGAEDLQAVTLCNLGRESPDGEAEKLYQGSLTLARKLDNPDVEVNTRLQLALLLERQNRQKEALEALLPAADRLEQMAAGLGSSQRGSFYGRRADVYNFLLQLLMHQGQVQQAFQVSERARARAYLESLALARLPQRPGVPEELLAREQSLRSELARADGRSARPPSVIRAELGQVMDKLRQASPESAALREIRLPSVPEVQQALGPDRVLLEYAVAPKPYPSFLFILTEQELRAVPLALDAASAQTEVEGLRRLMVREGRPPQSEQERVGQLLLGPAREELARAREILVVPSASLHYLPFGALSLEGEILWEKHPVSQIPSAAAWMLVRQRPPCRNQVVTLAAMGNIAVSWARSNHTLPPELRDGFSPLPGTLKEIQGIGQLYPGARSVVGPEMSAERVEELAHEARILHLATHGVLDRGAPMLSGIVTADRLVTVQDVMQWQLDADLTVLSACQTGLAPDAQGDELVGLTRAFQYAGSRAVLASLWKVSDDATRVWMVEFHRQLTAGRQPVEANRLAALEVRKAFPHPFYWAPFVLMGTSH